MKKIKNRAGAAMLISFAIILGLILLLTRLYDSGADWALFRANPTLYNAGRLKVGELTDSDGILLANPATGAYAEAASIRRACLHVVGDYGGMIGTGAIAAFADKLAGYTVANGTYSRTGEGSEVALTISAELSVAAAEALGGARGAVLVSDYRSGEILCMVSSPNYDPLNPPDFSMASEQYEGAYLNRAVSASYTPGSVFKIVTVAAAIENIADLSRRSFYCGGSLEVNGAQVSCSGVHGTQTFEKAFTNSCNSAFGELALELGAETIERTARELGLLDAHLLDGIPTAAGSFEAPVAGSADLAWAGIGQSKTLVSPYAMLRLSAAIANGGIVSKPTLLQSGGETELSRFLSGLRSDTGNRERILRASTAERLRDMMLRNVSDNYGDWRFPGLTVGAKTGTAEVGGGESHSWFTGFISDTEHPYAFTVVVEHGGAGIGRAAEIAGTVLRNAVGA